MDIVFKLILTVGLIALATGAGYLSRRTKLVPERAATWLMTATIAFGYSVVSFLAIWGMKLHLADAWLPAMAAVHIVLMGGVALLVARPFIRDRERLGVFGIASALGNTGFTMGGFVIYILFHEPGLALVSILGLMWMPVLVLLVYPTTRHFAGDRGGGSLGRLILRSIFDYRSIGLPVSLVAIGLSLGGVPRPDWITHIHAVDIMIFLITAAAYFSIGLRLHLSDIATMKRLLPALAGMRFLIGPALGLGLVALTHLTPWPLTGLRRDVLLIETCVPTAVTLVAVANMFSLRPRDASILFVVNTVMYLAIVLPVVLWVFR
jgi:predicted permease